MASDCSRQQMQRQSSNTQTSSKGFKLEDTWNIIPFHSISNTWKEDFPHVHRALHRGTEATGYHGYVSQRVM